MMLYRKANRALCNLRRNQLIKLREIKSYFMEEAMLSVTTITTKACVCVLCKYDPIQYSQLILEASIVTVNCFTGEEETAS